jgi:hypothetical protein
LQNTESSLNIFLDYLFCFCKFCLGSVLGISDGLYKCCPLWINAIRKVISNVVLMAIDDEVASWENRQDLCKTLISLREPDKPKETMPNP